MLHWNGNQWTQVPSPNPNPNPNYDINAPLAAAAISTNDVWTVGYTTHPGVPDWALIEHWNGIQWSLVPAPNPGPYTNYLYGIAAVSSNDIWAVGYYINNLGYDRTLVEHWNGVQWSIVPSPNAGASYLNNTLLSVSAVSTNDVWAVGSYGDQSTLTEHWNGVQWSVVPSPNPPSAQGTGFRGVAAISTSDAWAVGGYSSAPGVGGTVIEHWDGLQWNIISSPDERMMVNTRQLWAVSATSTNDVWTVGYYCCGPDGLTTLIEHWNGVQWSIVPSPNPSIDNNYLFAVAAISTNDVWAVGNFDYPGGPWQTLIEHYTAVCSTPTPSPAPSPSSTPSPSPTPTATVLLTTTSTSTPTSTPTITPAMTVTPAMTPTPLPILVGHVNWESRPTQPNQLQVLPITLTLKLGALEVDYPTQLTDQYGFFTVTVGGLPNGNYSWRVKGPDGVTHSQSTDPPGFLANTGTLALTGAPTTNAEMGTMRAGDANNDNVVNALDFTILKNTFGKSTGELGYDMRADFNGDNVVNASDFNALRNNFGHSGAPPIGAGYALKVQPSRKDTNPLSFVILSGAKNRSPYQRVGE